MKWIRRIFISILSAASLVYLISLLFDKEVVSAFSLTIPAQKEVVFDHLNDLRKWPDWTAWGMQDSSVQLTFSTESKGAGALMEWAKEDGRGKVTIIQSISDSLVDAEIALDGWSTMYSLMTVSTADSGTLVSWQLKTKLRNPINRIMGYFIKGWMLRDIKRGLRGLNAWLMNEGLSDGKILSIQYYENLDKTYHSLIVSDTLETLPGDSIRQHHFSILRDEMTKWGLEQVHDPFIHIRKWPVDSTPFIIDFGVTVKDIAKYKGDMMTKLHRRSLIIAKYTGSMYQWNMATDSIKSYAGTLSMETDSDPYITFCSTPIDNGVYKGVYPNLISLLIKEVD